MNIQNYYSNKKLARLGIMLGLVWTLSLLESLMPPLPFLPPGAKLGLSNIIIMYTVFFIGKKQAIGLNILKSAFVFIIRGYFAAFISLSGGIFSITIIVLVLKLSKGHLYIFKSQLGAVAHNIGQLTAVFLIMPTCIWIYYLPVLVIMGIVLGSVTGVILKVVIPILNKI